MSIPSAPSWPALTTAEVRAALAAVLRHESDLSAFCLDFFPSVYRDFAGGQTRVQRENLLLEKIDAPEIVQKLGELDATKLQLWLSQRAAKAAPGPGAQPLTFSLVERKSLVDSVWSLLLKERRLLLLAPERGGARTLARQVVAASGLREAAITWLAPATAAATPKSYFASLTGDPRVTSGADFVSWQRRRASGQRRHLIVLMHDGGPEKGLRELAATLRGLLHETDTPFQILVAGAAQAARLRFEMDDLSLFSGVRVVRVPELQIAEVAAVTALPHESAAALQQATGGHPGLLHDVVEGGPLPEQPADLGAEATTRLFANDRLSGLVSYRLRQDDRDKQKQRHAGLVLESLLNGKRVRRLDEPGVADDFRWGEVRLYYDGVVRPQRTTGETELRCAAVRQIAELCIRNWRDGQE